MKNKKKTQNKKLKNTPKILKTYEVLRVDWFDHFSGNKHWSDQKELVTDLPICTSVGMKVAEDKRSITLAQNISTFQNIADTVTIIKSCIDDIVKLGEVRYVQKPQA